ncbi:LytR/AlgR family response regulator transcription factor [Allomuricauda sp. NBRC 101325]|uniref:LytR/AlgR family response regulator transcription factor n=1 Tax=Allomuricauda sp. NBRC 101325 TaxID=1113758 RepID=UPI0024A36E5C|nr:LytTR family DNA-binding domain-containing protein [Muricauda sp. NBRC 101325]GLU45121.1 DNA-binding response regulator [Muricauda sp. NBRC 101325]
MIKCIAIDDEPLALALLQDNIDRISFLHLVATCNNAFEAIEVLQRETIDLIFIDIQMPGLTGLQLVSSLQNKPLVIFVTAYKEYAVESYDLDVVDYLVKPVALDRFIRACHRAQELHKAKTSDEKSPRPTKDYFFVNANYSQIKVKFTDIIWMKGYGDYIKFHLKSTEYPLVVRTSFKELEQDLPQNMFLRIHKSYAVAIDAITAIRKNSIFLGDKELSIGETYRERVAHLFNQ